MRIQLTSLSPQSVAALVSGLDLDPTEVFAATRGNPLLVREMMASGGGGRTTSLADAVMARLARLSIGGQEAIKTLSVLPEPVPRADLLGISGIDDDRLDEGFRRELLEEESVSVTFRHELIRRVMEGSLTPGERQAKHHAVLAGLPEETHPCLIIHCAVQVEDVDRLLVVSPRSARYAAAVGSHRQAVEDFRTLDSYLDRIDPEELGAFLGEWADEQYYVDRVDDALRVNLLSPGSFPCQR